MKKEEYVYIVRDKDNNKVQFNGKKGLYNCIGHLKRSISQQIISMSRIKRYWNEEKNENELRKEAMEDLKKDCKGYTVRKYKLVEVETTSIEDLIK